MSKYLYFEKDVLTGEVSWTPMETLADAIILFDSRVSRDAYGRSRHGVLEKSVHGNTWHRRT